MVESNSFILGSGKMTYPRSPIGLVAELGLEPKSVDSQPTALSSQVRRKVRRMLC